MRRTRTKFEMKLCFLSMFIQCKFAHNNYSIKLNKAKIKLNIRLLKSVIFAHLASINIIILKTDN